ncbi:BTAD domain-containing putative transcriptional regulator [Streptomyces sp. TRM 70351]|uniref:AfsR/SARP family transcriptional regulator n=1 Tax=Streptomyces sp. TRM 70351 TaxID=3116552 RepID=UPI002E7B524E|nr:BTAD domain-containing putative transcriptional regulator [Streptomyces sp. TRM 70351]MEE1931384.1 BTAD domain-containing putative transcriptional regulator [Streptomyces sp. TRM 70351]
MQFRVLGSPEVFDETRQRPVQLKSPKQRLLLGALLTRPSTPVPTEALIGEVWGERPPEKAVNALQAHVSRLRQLLIENEPARAEGPRLIARGPGYLLRVRPDELDCVRFRLLVARARACADADPGAACLFLQRALGLWRNPVPSDASFGPLYAEATARLEEERLCALEDLFDASLRLGRHRQVIARLAELAASHPGRPRLRQQLAQARQHAGGPRPEKRAGHPAEAAAGPGPRPTVSAVVRREAVSRDVARPPAGGPDERAPRTATLVEAGEFHRMRREIERLTTEQQELRRVLEHLTALVAAQAPTPASPYEPVPAAQGELNDTSEKLLTRVLTARPGAFSKGLRPVNAGGRRGEGTQATIR